MLLATIPFKAQPHKRAEILDAVRDTLRRMRKADGCGRSRLLVDVEDPNAYVLVSEWWSADFADAFFNTPEFHTFKYIRVLFKDKPVILFDNIQTRTTALLQRDLPRPHDAKL
jgi:quinol monooxygenase YgiN